MSKKPYKAEGWENIVVNDADGNTLVACAGATLEKAKANAALFAAAPELLAGLQSIIEIMDSQATLNNQFDRMWIKKLIDKATNV